MAVASTPEGSSSSSMDTDTEERGEGMVSLVEAIKAKYCSGPQEYYGPEVLPVFRVIKEYSPKSKPGAAPVEEKTDIIVDDKSISESGPVEELTAMCPMLKTLHMTNNLLKDWESIFTIISSMPLLQHLNLTSNRTLSSAHSVSLPLPYQPHQSLAALHLSCTCIPFITVMGALSVLPNLSELHLSCNQYTDSDVLEVLKEKSGDGGSPIHLKVSKLYLVENQLAQWSSIECIGVLFPNLLSLILNSNPLRKISPKLCPNGGESLHFHSLETLNLNDTQLDEWESVEQLGRYPRLRNVSTLRVSLGEKMTMKDRRYAAIARLPRLLYLNKSLVSEEERQDAERWLLREYQDHPSPPQAFIHLQEKHGHLQPLAQVSLEPVKVASMSFSYDGIERPDEVLDVDLMQMTRQFRRWVGQRILVPPSKLRIFYYDSEAAEVYRVEELKFDSKALYTYRMKNGDKIEVYVKQ